MCGKHFGGPSQQLIQTVSNRITEAGSQAVPWQTGKLADLFDSQLVQEMECFACQAEGFDGELEYSVFCVVFCCPLP